MKLKIFKPLRKRLEIILAQCGLLVLPRCPRRVIVSLSRLLGSLAYRCSGSLRRIGLANLDLAYADTLSASQKKRILRRSMQTFALTILDVFWFTRDAEARIKRYVHAKALEDALPPDQPAICITAHMGSWELLGQVVILAGHSLASVANPLMNPAVDEVLVRGRTQLGQQNIPRKGAMRGMMKQLKQGGKIALLLDQNTLPDEGGVWTDFYGHPVPVSSASAALALITSAEMIFPFCAPRPDGHYEAFLGEPVPIPPDTDPRDRQALIDLTQRIMNTLGKAIRTRPDAWLWSYKRWKYIPPDVPTIGNWPFYARPAQPAAPKDPL